MLAKAFLRSHPAGIALHFEDAGSVLAQILWRSQKRSCIATSMQVLPKKQGSCFNKKHSAGISQVLNNLLQCKLSLDLCWCSALEHCFDSKLPQPLKTLEIALPADLVASEICPPAERALLTALLVAAAAWLPALSAAFATLPPAACACCTAPLLV